MAQKIDFEELKALVSVVDVAAWLGVKTKQNGANYRGDCPLCGKERSFTLTPAKNLFGCFGCQTRGSIIDMVFHIKKTANIRDAALLIQQHFLGGDSKTVPAPAGHSSPPIMEKRQEEGELPKNSRIAPEKGDNSPPNGGADLSAKLAKVRDRLQYEHEAVQALGLSPEVAKAFDIGYCASGIMRGRICFPLFLDGVLSAFTGLATSAEQAPLMLFPPNLGEIVASPKVEKPQPGNVRDFLRVVR